MGRGSDGKWLEVTGSKYNDTHPSPQSFLYVPGMTKDNNQPVTWPNGCLGHFASYIQGDQLSIY